jgi:hypothetical protein
LKIWLTISEKYENCYKRYFCPIAWATSSDWLWAWMEWPVQGYPALRGNPAF